jgi:hypothetical protein
VQTALTPDNPYGAPHTPWDPSLTTQGTPLLRPPSHPIGPHLSYRYGDAQVAMAQANEQAGGGGMDAGRANRMLRLMRMAKLAKLARMRKLAKYMESFEEYLNPVRMTPSDTWRDLAGDLPSRRASHLTPHCLPHRRASSPCSDLSSSPSSAATSSAVCGG